MYVCVRFIAAFFCVLLRQRVFVERKQGRLVGEKRMKGTFPSRRFNLPGSSSQTSSRGGQLVRYDFRDRCLHCIALHWVLACWYVRKVIMPPKYVAWVFAHLIPNQPNPTEWIFFHESSVWVEFWGTLQVIDNIIYVSLQDRWGFGNRSGRKHHKRHDWMVKV